MQQVNPISTPAASLREFIDSPTGNALLGSADAAFGRVDFGTASGFLRSRLGAMPDIEGADDLALGDLLEQVMALRSCVASLNSVAAEFYRQSGGLDHALAAIKAFIGSPTADNRLRLMDAATPLDGFHIRMPPRVRRGLRPFIKRYYWRQELLSYGKLYPAIRDHLKVGVIVG